MEPIKVFQRRDLHNAKQTAASYMHTLPACVFLVTEMGVIMGEENDLSTGSFQK